MYTHSQEPLTREEVEKRDVIVNGVDLVPSPDSSTCPYPNCPSNQLDIIVVASCRVCMLYHACVLILLGMYIHCTVMYYVCACSIVKGSSLFLTFNFSKKLTQMLPHIWWVFPHSSIYDRFNLHFTCHLIADYVGQVCM